MILDAEINRVIEKLPKENFRYSSLRFEYFSVLLQNSAALIGNSSAGVREALFLGIPSLNVGLRQTGRSMATSITHVMADEKKQDSRIFGPGVGAEKAS